MRLTPALRIGTLIAAMCPLINGQTAPPKDPALEAKGMPPRTAPGEYQSHAQLGAVTIAAEFKGHSVPTMQGPLTTDDYVVIETAMFGAAGATMKLTADDFSLRINGKKSPLSSQPYGLVIGNVKDPEWDPEPAAPKSKSRVGGSSKSDQESDGPPAPVKIPVSVQRAMAQRVQKAALPEGDRALPLAGLVFFQYRGKTQGIHTIELLYDGPAGKATLTMQP